MLFDVWFSKHVFFKKNLSAGGWQTALFVSFSRGHYSGLYDFYHCLLKPFLKLYLCVMLCKFRDLFFLTSNRFIEVLNCSQFTAMSLLF